MRACASARAKFFSASDRENAIDRGGARALIIGEKSLRGGSSARRGRKCGSVCERLSSPLAPPPPSLPPRVGEGRPPGRLSLDSLDRAAPFPLSARGRDRGEGAARANFHLFPFAFSSAEFLPSKFETSSSESRKQPST